MLDLVDTARRWRRDLHRIPECGLDTHETANYVAEKLRSFGIETHTGIGGAGVVGVLPGGSSAKSGIGLRADMDALQIHEQNEFSHASNRPGHMHACGHDGHTAILLGAARVLAAASDLLRTVTFVFQPGEEHGLGARAMINDGLFERFRLDEIYALHNLPGLPVGTIALRTGAIMAAEDNFEIVLSGKGGHAARPQVCNDVLVAGCQLVSALQTIVARRIDPLDEAVVSVTEFVTDGVRNALAGRCTIRGDCRSYKKTVQALIESEMRRITQGVAAAFEVDGEVQYSHEFLPTVNSPAETERARTSAAALHGATLIRDCPPLMASDDFGLMLAHRPGAYAFLGNGGVGSPGAESLHSARYNFNDDALRFGIEYFVQLACGARQ
jgi:amidohydrolase